MAQMLYLHSKTVNDMDAMTNIRRGNDTENKPKIMLNYLKPLNNI